MGLLSSVKKAFGGGSKKKEKKKQKKPQKKTYIQNTNVGKKATARLKFLLISIVKFFN